MAGLIVGVAAAALGFMAARSLFGRVSARLDDEAAKALPLYAEGSALLAAGISVLFPPLAILVVARARLAAHRWPPPGRREVRRAADPAVKGEDSPFGLASLASPRADPAMSRKLVLAVIDAMKPAMLERAIATGRAPTLQLLIERGQLRRRMRRGLPVGHAGVRGVDRDRHRPGEHDIPAMNWWHRGEERYVEYGTSFGASRAFGIRQSLTDTIYNMNLEHLSQDVKTVFERSTTPTSEPRHDLPDVPRAPPARAVGRHRALAARPHGVRAADDGPEGALLRRPVRVAQDVLPVAARAPGRARPALRLRAEYMVEHDLFDFLLLSLPDNDTHSHKYGPFAQVDSIAAADRQIARMMEPAGGPEKFLEDHAVIVCSDHSQSKVEGEIDLFKAFDGFGLRAAQRSREDDEIAVCPNSRAAQVYVLDRDKRRSLIPRIERTLLALEGVDLVMRMGDHPDGEASSAASAPAASRSCASPRAATSSTRAARAGASRATSTCSASRSRTTRSARPPTRTRWPRLVRAALPDRRRGPRLARPGYEFLDWGGAHHVGGGSHGSLHANDSNAALIWAGTGPEKDAREQWALRDIVPMITEPLRRLTRAASASRST